MKGTANVPAKKPTAKSMGAQEKLKGTEGQFVGFDQDGNAVAQDMSAIMGIEAEAAAGKYMGFDAEGNLVALDPPESEGIDLEGAEGQFVGFDEEGNLKAVDPPTSTGAAFFGTIGLDWTEDEATGVKSQLVAIEGVLEAHNLGCLDTVMTHERTTEGYAAFVEEQNQFLEFITNGDAETVDGGVMFYIYGDANTVEIPFSLVVV